MNAQQLDELRNTLRRAERQLVREQRTSSTRAKRRGPWDNTASIADVLVSVRTALDGLDWIEPTDADAE